MVPVQWTSESSFYHGNGHRTRVTACDMPDSLPYRRKRLHANAAPNRIRGLSKSQLEEALDGCRYMRDVLRKLGFPLQAYLGTQLQRMFELHGIDTSQLAIKRRQDLTGRVFGHLIVLRVGPTLLCGNTTWICREEETGIEKPVLSKHLLKGSTKSFSFAARRGEKHHQWTGHGKISGQFWRGLCRHAEARLITVDITIEDAWQLFLKQDGKCALSGEVIYFGETGLCPHTASLDRIDSAKGYTQDNIQWVHTKINIMKNRYSQCEFIDFCRKIATKHAA